MNKQPRLLVMAGGTGGHVFPGLAVAEQLKKQGWDIQWLGTADRMEATLVPQHEIPIHFIQIQGLRGNGIKRLLQAPFKIVRAIWQAMRIIRTLQPDVVIGMGGYASGPGGIAARVLGKPLVLHEQNAVAGMTNRYLAKVASRVLTAFPNTLESAKTEVVGNPVRERICAIEAAQPHQALRVLVVGGSLGAKVLNDVVPQAVAQTEQDSVEVWHQTGKNNQASTQALYDAHGLKCARVHSFIDDMAAAYAWADVVICRAGALTVSELAAAGKPSLLVPFPHAVDDHQTGNAKYLTERGAGVLMAQNQLNAERLAQELNRLLSNPNEVQQMAQNAHKAAQRGAAERVAAVCSELSKSR